MKKIVLLTSVLAAMSSFAATTGEVEFTNDTATNFANTANLPIDVWGSIKSTSVENKLKLKMGVTGTGLTFGLETKNNTALNNYTLSPQTVLDNTSGYVKYDLPTLFNVNTFVKGELKAKSDTNRKLVVEAGASTMVGTTKLGAELKNEVLIARAPADQLEGKLYYENATLANNRLTLNGEIKAKGSFDQTQNLEYKNIGLDDDASLAKGLFVGTYTGGLKYVNGGLTFEGKGGLQNVLTYPADSKTTNYFNGNVSSLLKYTIGGFTLEGKMFAGMAVGSYSSYSNNTWTASTPGMEIKNADKAITLETANVQSTVTFKPEVKAEYSHQATDKLNMTAGLKLELKDTMYVQNMEKLVSLGMKYDNKLDFTATPEVKAVYTPVSGLSLTAKVETPVAFTSNNFKVNNGALETDFGYANTTVKTGLSVKYTW